MDNKQRQDLDRYITGDYGERQFVKDISVHEEYDIYNDLGGLYAYDPTNDGPECEIITRILAADWYYEIDRERLRA